MDVELAKPNLWENAAKAGQFSRERGALSGQVKSVISMEDELLEHVGLAELAHEENDTQVVTVSECPLQHCLSYSLSVYTIDSKLIYFYIASRPRYLRMEENLPV